MQKISIKAYAKLNLSMEILARRADNFHEVRTLMQFVGLYDRIDIKISDKFCMKCSDKALQNDDNLCARAYFAICEYMAESIPCVEIYLEKNIPYLSGLGGGSADAAAVLVGLNTMLNLGLEKEELLKIAKSVGSDVPACVLGGLVLAEGRGEMVQRLAPLAKTLNFIIIKPKFNFSSKAMYKLLDERDMFSVENYTQRTLQSFDDMDGIYLYNGFVVPDYAKDCIDGLKAKIYASGAVASSMTGAGSAVFGIFKDAKAAEFACENLRKALGEEYFVTYCPSVDVGMEFL